ncbi:MAG: preprotein translocase subunit SecG [Dehalococcoidia bacterium]|nr:preprotein translocase subunit SecG [Dehalococcoidia bacterium]
MLSYLNIAQIIIAVCLISAIMLQVRGGGLGGIFGSQTGTYRTKRGMEKTLFQLTVILAAIFIIISIFAVRVAS